MWWINNIDYCMGWIIHLLQPTRHQTFSNTALSMQNLSLSLSEKVGDDEIWAKMQWQSHVMYMLDADLRIVPSAWHSGKTHSHIRQLNQLAPFKLFTKTSYSLFFLFSSNNSNICLVNTLHRNSSHFCAFHSVFLLIGAFLIVFDNVVRYLFFCLHVFVFRVAHRNQLTCTILWEIEENGEKKNLITNIYADSFSAVCMALCYRYIVAISCVCVCKRHL